MKTYLKLFIVIILLFSLVQACVPLPYRIPKEKNGKLYGVTKGLFRHKWWNYYERGLSFSDGEFWQYAIDDFQIAISKKYNDKKRARTYGVHVTYYYPHRELGYVYYMQSQSNFADIDMKRKLLADAERELKISIKTAESEKAKYYLNRVREQLGVLKKATDIYKIDIEKIDNMQYKYNETFLTNNYSIHIKGKAAYDNYLKSININSKEYPFDIYEKEKNFDIETDIQAGKNVLTVIVTDVNNNQSDPVFLSVYMDNSGPIIGIDEITKSDSSILIRGYVTDYSDILNLKVDGKAVDIKNNDNTNLYPFITKVPITSNDQILIECHDKAGNVNTAHVNWKSYLSERKKTKFYAQNMTSEAAYIASDVSENVTVSSLMANNKPIIFLYDIDWCNIYETYSDKHTISGNIDGRGVNTCLKINDKEIVNKKLSGVYYFNYAVELKEGNNAIKIEAIDNDSKTKTPSVVNKTIRYKNLSTERIPLSIVTYTFTDENRNIYFNSKVLEENIKLMIKKKGRFTSDSEADIQNNATIDTEKKNTVFFSLEGIIRKDNSGTEIMGFMLKKNTESKKSLTSILDVYVTFTSDIDELAKKIHEKLEKELPVAEGKVTKLDKKGIEIDITQDRIKKYMPIVLFNIKREPKFETISSIKAEPIAQAFITDIEEKGSEGELFGTINNIISKDNMVITR